MLKIRLMKIQNGNEIMITKEILKKIISDNNDASNEQRTEKLGYGPKKKALLQYLNSFSREDQIYLFALLDYGRDKYQMRSKEKSKVLFGEKMITAKTHSNDEYIAEYLIQKGRNMSYYFEYALNILEE